MRRNVTVQLDEESIAKARVLAARRSTSMSQLLADALQRMVDEDDHYRLARATALRHLAAGWTLGGGSLPARDELHER
jgi:hypothetical protein